MTFARLILAACLLLAGCDDMISQPKKNAYADARVGPGPVPANTVQYRAEPTPAPPLTLALVERGQARFRIFCTPCHGERGDGHGMIVQRGFSPPPSYHSERLRGVSDQHIFDVITGGWGAMYGYAQRVPATSDRWAIVAYVRALQASQNARIAALTDAERDALR